MWRRRCAEVSELCLKFCAFLTDIEVVTANAASNASASSPTPSGEGVGVRNIDERVSGQDPEDERRLDFIRLALRDASGDREEAATIILDNANEGLLETRSDREALRAEVLDWWGGAIDGLDLLLCASTEAGEEWDERHGDEIFDPQSGLFRARALQQLWGASLTVGHEIVALLSSGLGGGAYARWRTLHELQVVARFIGSADEDTALRYLDREDLRATQANLRWHAMAKQSGLVSHLSHEEKEEAKQIEKTVLSLNGSEIKSDFGWAHAYLYAADSKYRERCDDGRRTKVPRFDDLQGVVGLGAFGRRYADACMAIHASPVYGTHHLPEELRGQISGPSIYGLELAGSLSAEAIIDILAVLVAAHPVPPEDQLTQAVEILRDVESFVGGSFQDAEEELMENNPPPVQDDAMTASTDWVSWRLAHTDRSARPRIPAPDQPNSPRSLA